MKPPDNVHEVFDKLWADEFVDVAGFVFDLYQFHGWTT